MVVFNALECLGHFIYLPMMFMLINLKSGTVYMYVNLRNTCHGSVELQMLFQQFKQVLQKLIYGHCFMQTEGT